MYQMYLCTYVCRIGYGPCYFPEYPYSAPPPPALTPPFTALGSQQKRSALLLLLRTFAVFVC